MQAKQTQHPLPLSDKSLATHNTHALGVKNFRYIYVTLSDFCTKTKDPLEKHTNPQEVIYIYDYNTNINIRLKFATILLI